MSSIISTKEKEDECRKITPVMIMEHTGENSLHDVNCLVLRGMNVSDFDSLEYVSLSLSLRSRDNQNQHIQNHSSIELFGDTVA